MRFLADAGISPEIADFLRRNVHEAGGIIKFSADAEICTLNVNYLQICNENGIFSKC